MLQVILVAVCVAGLSQDCGPKGTTSDMVSGGAGEAEPDRLDPCKVLPWPKPIDIENDILLPQFSDKWFAELRGALQSRFLLEVVDEADPTKEQWIGWYKDTDYSTEQLMQFYDKVMEKRQEKKTRAARQMLDIIKPDKLTMSQTKKLLDATTRSDAVFVYKFIKEACDLSRGLSQDKVRMAYEKIEVHAHATSTELIQAIERKWWLLGKHTNHGLASPRAVFDAVKEVLRMLLAGPPKMAAAATLEFTSLNETSFPDEAAGNEWIDSKVQMLKQHGTMLTCENGYVMQMAPEKTTVQGDEPDADTTEPKEQSATEATEQEPNATETKWGQGTVTYYSKRGFGYITPDWISGGGDIGQDIFFHVSNVDYESVGQDFVKLGITEDDPDWEIQFEPIQYGDYVSFDVEYQPEREDYKAVAVTLTKDVEEDNHYGETVRCQGASTRDYTAEHWHAA